MTDPEPVVSLPIPFAVSLMLPVVPVAPPRLPLTSFPDPPTPELVPVVPLAPGRFVPVALVPSVDVREPPGVRVPSVVVREPPGVSVPSVVVVLDVVDGDGEGEPSVPDVAPGTVPVAAPELVPVAPLPVPPDPVAPPVAPLPVPPVAASAVAESAAKIARVTGFVLMRSPFLFSLVTKQGECHAIAGTWIECSSERRRLPMTTSHRPEPTRDRMDEIAHLAKCIKDVEFAMLTTVAEDGTLHSRPMATQATDFDGTLWFFTRDDAPKASEIRHDAHVNVAYVDPKSHAYVSISGKGRLNRDRSRIESLWRPQYRAWFPEGVDDPHLALLEITVQSAQLWNPPTSPVVHLFGMAKAILTGKPARPGGNEKLDLERKAG